MDRWLNFAFPYYGEGTSMLCVDRRGEGVVVEKSRRLLDPELRRTRAMQMLNMYRAGQPVSSIARYFRLTTRQVYYDLSSIPGWQRSRLDGQLG